MIKLGLRARDIDGVIEEILDLVRRNINRRIFYFHGWSSYGASALLSYMARVLPTMKDPSPGLLFGRVIYLDCSMWKSRREMQRKIAEELKLDRKIMAMFDEQDEDVIQDIAAVIDRTLRESRFMVIFINGSDDEIVLSPFGIPEYHDCTIIWTSRRFNITNFYSRKVTHTLLGPHKKIRHTSVVLHSLWRLSDLTTSNLSTLLHEEAAILACMRDTDLTMAIDGFFYRLFMSGHREKTYHQSLQDLQDLPSYWICDGVIQGGKAREICNALLQSDMSSYSTRDGRAIASDLSSRKKTPYLIGTDDDLVHACGERPYRWISVRLQHRITSKNKKIQEDIQNTLAMASSILLHEDRQNTLLGVLFKQHNNIRVLILVHCSFSFEAPPFLHCHTLRLLDLDHCTDGNTTLLKGEDNNIQPKWKWACFHSLQVLRLHYTEWGEILSEEKLCLMANLEELNIEGVWCWQCICELEKRLPNLKSLRVIKPAHQVDSSIDISNSLIDKTKLEVLDLCGNKRMKKLPTNEPTNEPSVPLKSALTRHCTCHLCVLQLCFWGFPSGHRVRKWARSL